MTYVRSEHILKFLSLRYEEDMSISYAELLQRAKRSANPLKHFTLIGEFCEHLNVVQAWDDQAAEFFANLQAQLFSKYT